MGGWWGKAWLRILGLAQTEECTGDIRDEQIVSIPGSPDVRITWLKREISSIMRKYIHVPHNLNQPLSISLPPLSIKKRYFEENTFMELDEECLRVLKMDRAALLQTIEISTGTRIIINAMEGNVKKIEFRDSSNISLMCSPV